MENVIEIWKQICESNLFNFVVMILLLAWMVKKFDLGSKIESGRKRIENTIADSEKAKEENLKKLYEVQENVTKIDEQMLEVFKVAENNAKTVGERMLEDGKNQSALIKESSKKAIEANAKAVKNDVLRETAQEAMSLAEQRIKSELERDSNLHEKFIYESIDAINDIGVNL